jgi:nucleotide-binding universal stress UspA family protein
MISNILVATDGSDTARLAVDVAAQIAAGLQLPLTVGHVLQHGAQVEELSRMAEAEHMVHHAATTIRLDVADIPSNMDALFSGEFSKADRDRLVAVIGDEIVARAATRAEDAGAKSVTVRVEDGDYDTGILKMAKDVGADAIVIGHRGLGRLERLVQGSVSQKVVQKAECTVIVAR